jgi:hypothetical protein
MTAAEAALTSNGLKSALAVFFLAASMWKKE